jgi:thiol-disulfide isomerase/thioredoxin
MNSSMRAAFAVACAVAVAAANVRAANMGITTADIALGGLVAGPAVEATSLAGSVVVLEFWGIHCPPCIASMPGLETLHKQLGPQGLVVIGAHAQGGSPDEVRKTVAELGVTFPIVESATVANGMDFGGIPHCMVFDHTGKCVYRGSPGGAHDVIVAAVQAAPAGILAGRDLVKFAGLANTLKDESTWGTALKMVKPLVESKDEATADEARFVVERMEGRGREMLARARDIAAADPVEAVALVQRCATVFRGDEIGKEALALTAEWKKDKAFQATLRAGQQLARLDVIRAQAEALPGGVPPQAVVKAREIARMIDKGASGSMYADKAAKIVAALEAAAGGQP